MSKEFPLDGSYKFLIVPSIFIFDENLSDSEFRTLAAMMTFDYGRIEKKTDQAPAKYVSKGYCDVIHSKLGALLNKTEKAIKNNTGSLRDKGYIISETLPERRNTRKHLVFGDRLDQQEQLQLRLENLGLLYKKDRESIEARNAENGNSFLEEGNIVPPKITSVLPSGGNLSHQNVLPTSPPEGIIIPPNYNKSITINNKNITTPPEGGEAIGKPSGDHIPSFLKSENLCVEPPIPDFPVSDLSDYLVDQIEEGSTKVTPKKINTTTILEYFKTKYENRYKLPISINGKDPNSLKTKGIIKQAFINQYKEDPFGVIDKIFEYYDKSPLYSKEYPRPTLILLTKVGMINKILDVAYNRSELEKVIETREKALVEANIKKGRYEVRDLSDLSRPIQLRVMQSVLLGPIMYRMQQGLLPEEWYKLVEHDTDKAFKLIEEGAYEG